jgi:nuclear pore complex protein Nup93
MLHILSTITFEPPAVPPSHSQAHILNTPLLERAYARAYQDPPESPEAIKLRKRIAEGARRALEQQLSPQTLFVLMNCIVSRISRLWDILERTLQQNVVEAALGGDPAPSNKVRAYLSLRFYKNGRWEDKLEVCLSLTSLEESG